jgi:hypothetical protein
VALAALPGAAGAAHAQGQALRQAAGKTTAGPAAVDGAIAGVVRSVTGEGLRGICVTALSGTFVVPSVTTSGGQYLLTGLRPGPYSVSYQACRQPRAYLPVQSPRVTVRPGRPSLATPMTLRPASGAGLVAASRPALRAAALTAGKPVVSGTVRNSRGQALPGICVGAAQPTSGGGGGGAPPSGPDITTQTSRNGTYNFGASALPSGTWLIEFFSGCGNKANFAPQWWKYAATSGEAKTLTIKKGSRFTGIDGKLVPGAAISGIVRAGGKTGSGLAGVCVTAAGYGAAAAVIVQTISRAGGRYLITGLGTGKYQVQFQPGCGNPGSYSSSNYPKAVSVKDGSTVKGIDWYVPLAGEITGVVTAGQLSTPVKGICVVGAAVLPGGVAEIDETVTGLNGSYAFTGLDAASYVVGFQAGCGSSGSYVSQYYDNQSNPENTSLVKVKTGQHVAGIDANLAPGGTITGVVTSAGGKDLSGICVIATSDVQAFSSVLLPGPPGEAALSGATLGVTKNGRYVITDLTPASYSVSFTNGCGQSSAPSYAAQWFAPPGFGSGPAWVSVGASTVSGISAALRPSGEIKGVVTTTAGKPLANICVFAAGLSDEPSPLLAELGLDAAFPASGQNGVYRIDGLAAGKYAIEFTPCSGAGYAPSWYSRTGGEATARAVTVKDSQVTGGINQVMTGGSALTGQISGAGGQSVKNTCVEAFDSEGNFSNGTVSTPGGAYVIARLAPGTYQVEFAPCDGQGKLATVVKSVTIRASVAKTALNATLPLAGTLKGKVTGGSPAAAVPGICVVAAPVTGSGAAGGAYSRPDGSYVLPGLAPGTYRVTFSADCPFQPGSFGSQSAASQVTVTSGQVTSGVSGQLAADGAISGHVTVSGSPAAGVCVLARPASGGGPVTLATTGPLGGYRLAGLLPGSFTVEFTAGCGDAQYHTQWYNGAPSQSGATDVTVTSGVVTPGIDAS